MDVYDSFSTLVMKIKVFLILAHCICSVSADVNIDCGSADSYVDENIHIWIGDASFMANGESEVVQNSNSISHVLDTLRVFTTRKKNCYSVQSDRGGRVLVRASFNYGNYDRKSSPPTFDLHLDGNLWVTVVTSETDYVYHEAIYSPRGDTVNVCVAQTKPGQFPFMSALEVHSLDSGMYRYVDGSSPLLTVTRVAYGATSVVRDDPYGRIWTPAVGGDGQTTVTSDAIIIQSNVADNPPQYVLRNGVAAVAPSGQIQLLTGLPIAAVPVYLNMYFNEVTQLDTTETRSFQVLMDNKPLFDQPIIPVYANCTEFYATNFTASSKTTFVLVPTKDSTQPPLINAMEVYTIGDVMADGTDSQDVKGLDALQTAFPVLQDWSGDPCLPAPYSWDWINCTTDSSPRVSALYLSSFDLSGDLPDFSSMDALVTIDFHNNSLTGGIPDFLATFPNLKKLNLATNQLSGPIPNALSKKNGLNLDVSGNPNLCKPGASSCSTTATTTTTTTTGSPSDILNGLNPGGSSSSSGNIRKKKSSKLPVILGTTIPLPVVISVFLFFVRWYHKRKHNAVANTGHGGYGPQASSSTSSPLGKMGEAMMNGIKTSIEDEIVNNMESQATGGQQPNSGVGGI